MPLDRQKSQGEISFAYPEAEWFLQHQMYQDNSLNFFLFFSLRVLLHFCV